ncbi:hypothetical protein HDU93_000508 [Gonapodya sp. JEL0774]|nr:hypothetical protein HDU93_000508 [Gonapodya sp. JEL0774]
MADDMIGNLAKRADPTTGRQFDPLYFGFAYNGLTAIWVIVYTALCIWVLVWLMEIFWKMFSRSLARNKLPPPPSGPGSSVNDREFYAKKGPSLGQRLANASRLIRDMFIIFTAANVISYTGFGVTAAPTVLLWIAFALACLWIAVKIFFDNPFVDLVMVFPIATLILIVFGLAFRGGPNPFTSQIMAPNNYDYALSPVQTSAE